jgi:hypothetical protein
VAQGPWGFEALWAHQSAGVAPAPVVRDAWRRDDSETGPAGSDTADTGRTTHRIEAD